MIYCLNRLFPSCLLPLYQDESKCETSHMQISSTYRFIFMQIKVIFIRIVSHVDSFWNRGTGQLGIGVFSIPCRQIPVPQEARAVLWDQCIRLINRTFVEGWVSYLDKWLKGMQPSTVLCFHDVLTGIVSFVLVFWQLRFILKVCKCKEM